MGPPITLGSNLSAKIDLDCPDIIYLTTRLVDESCIGVLEIVVSQFDAANNVFKSQYG